jgi:hypothetical protein
MSVQKQQLFTGVEPSLLICDREYILDIDRGKMMNCYR